MKLAIAFSLAVSAVCIGHALADDGVGLGGPEILFRKDYRPARNEGKVSRTCLVHERSVQVFHRTQLWDGTERIDLETSTVTPMHTDLGRAQAAADLASKGPIFQRAEPEFASFTEYRVFAPTLARDGAVILRLRNGQRVFGRGNDAAAALVELIDGLCEGSLKQVAQASSASSEKKPAGDAGLLPILPGPADR